jgi:putative transposase
MSRQAYYKNRIRQATEESAEEIVTKLIKEVRQQLPRLGGLKLYKVLNEDIRKLNIKLGRDKFFEILRKNGLLIEPIKQYVVTTNSHHRFRVYSNLTKELNIKSINKLWVSDITYIRLDKGFCYLFLTTDVYSRKIVGYKLSLNLGAEGAVLAMKMALKNVKGTEGLIHHSDRGFQYCSNNYVRLLNKHGIKISMGEAGNPYENAIAERVNGILKTEFYLNATFRSYEIALKATMSAIDLYNNIRPHMSLNYLTPSNKYAA